MEITTRNSHLIHEASGRTPPTRVVAAPVRGDAARSPALKTPDQFRLMGKSVARRAISKVDGTAAFGIDADAGHEVRRDHRGTGLRRGGRLVDAAAASCGWASIGS